MPKTTKKALDISFETLLEELTGVVERMESGELTLQDSLTLFERGTALARQCEGLLDDAQVRVDQLIGEPETLPHDKVKQDEEDDLPWFDATREE